MDRQRRYRRRYCSGQVAWIEPGLQPEWAQWQQSVLGEVACQRYWHPPLRCPSEETISGIARDLLKEAGHVRADLVANPLARMFYVHDQVDQQSTEDPTYGIVSPCTWCGKFTGNFCDGLLATATQRGWACSFPVCTTCEALLDTCRHCSLWKGLPSQVSDGGRKKCSEDREALGAIMQKALSNSEVLVKFWPAHMQESLRLYMHVHFPAKPLDECAAEVLKACSVIAFCVPLGSEESGVTDVLPGTEGEDEENEQCSFPFGHMK